MPAHRPLIDEPATHLRRIPIREIGEPMQDILSFSPRLHWAPRHPVFAYRRLCLIRESVGRMLAAAAGRLPSGVRLGIVEGWRAPAIQAQMREATRARLAAEHPEWGPAVLARAVDRFSARIDPEAPPPHTTGAAVDVLLVDESGRPLDCVSPYSLLDPRAAPAAARGLSPEARRNRRLLCEAMESAGLTNYRAEWWHWSHGDQGWAYRGGHAVAVYGEVTPPEAEGLDFTFAVHQKPGWQQE